jgi:DNA polymerase III epsilon subunit-like protein
MPRVIAFDTETTDKGPVGGTPGLTYKEKQVIERALVEKDTNIASTYWAEWVEQWPRITQLSYILYDTDNPSAAKIFNKYIDLPPDVIIAAGASAVTKVFTTPEDVVAKNITLVDESTGVPTLLTPTTPGIFVLSEMKRASPESFLPIEAAMAEFMADLKTCNFVVAHNIDFDKKMILAELVRLKREPDFYGILAEDNFICTMMRSIQVCKIAKMNKFGRMEYKWPKLKEAYQTLFGYEPTGDALHNAIIDVIVCLRVFFKLGVAGPQLDICGTNAEITELINSISPPAFKCPTAGGRKKRRAKKTKKQSGKLRRSKRLHKRV